MVKILLIDDDEVFAKGMEAALTGQHYLVDATSDGQAGWDLAESFSYDLVLLDWQIPKIDGLTFCRRLRNQGNRTPILLMTAYDSGAQRVTGLDAGADDYLVKPFAIEELLARVRALLRRGNDVQLPVVEWGVLRLEPSRCQVTCQGKVLKLTAKEYELLDLFLRSPQRIFSQSALLDRLWSFDDPPSENAVRRQITNLRQKLKRAGAGDAIETIYGLGYRLREVKLEKPDSENPLAAVWERHKHKYLDRIAIIALAVEALKQGSLSDELHQQALTHAHTLAGSLGSFGLDRASEIAREIDRQLRENLTDVTVLQDNIRQLHVTLDLPVKASVRANERKTHLKVPMHLFVVDADVAFAEALATEAKLRGMTVTIVHTLSDARSIASQQTPDLASIDLSLPDADDGGFELLEQLTQGCPPVPVVVLTDRENFFDRLKVARLGGCGFLQKPVSPQQAIETVSQLGRPPRPEASKILVVDDDAELLEVIRQQLEPWGFELSLLDDPRQFWEVLNDTKPDLLLLDVVMPEVNGIELCQVVRSDPKWYDLPVLVLSAYRDTDTVHQVFVAGADDFIQKPLVEPELIARILNRLERRRLQQRLGRLWQSRR